MLLEANTTAAVYREEGRTAHVDAIAKRPVFRQLLHDAALGQFDIVIVHTLDRWARNLRVQLENHITKGVSERALQGKHLGSGPFGYLPCSLAGCDPEHPGGVHPVESEAAAVRTLFRRYATGTTTCVRLAAWMNREGFRTRNRHRFGRDEAEGQFFTNSSVKTILKNAFYAGRIRHRDELLDGVHEALVSWAQFEQV